VNDAEEYRREQRASARAAITLIRNTIEEQEAAIRSHPPETSQKYFLGLAALAGAGAAAPQVAQVAAYQQAYEALIEEWGDTEEGRRKAHMLAAYASRSSDTPPWIPYWIPNWVQRGLSTDDYVVLNRLMFCSSFISAWYHLSGDVGRRNQVANACIVMASSLGLEPDVLMPLYVEGEQSWCRVLTYQGAGKQSCLATIVLVAMISSLFWAVIR
jgi:hypothetical protein